MALLRSGASPAATADTGSCWGCSGSPSSPPPEPGCCCCCWYCSSWSGQEAGNAAGPEAAAAAAGCGATLKSGAAAKEGATPATPPTTGSACCTRASTPAAGGCCPGHAGLYCCCSSDCCCCSCGPGGGAHPRGSPPHCCCCWSCQGSTWVGPARGLIFSTRCVSGLQQVMVEGWDEVEALGEFQADAAAARGPSTASQQPQPMQPQTCGSGLQPHTKHHASRLNNRASPGPTPTAAPGPRTPAPTRGS